jgi:DNA mismatch repair ATPase MutS
MFKLPIEYNKHMILATHIVDDLELLKLNETADVFDQKSIFGQLFKSDNAMTKNALIKMTHLYSYDKNYLKETQKVIKLYKSKHNDLNLDTVYSKWNEIKNTTNFKDVYNYCSWSALEFLNNNDSTLQIITIYTLLSPILSLSIPIFGLLIPFIIIKLKGSRLNCKEYFDILKYTLKNHALTNALTCFNETDMNKKMYTVFSLLFYLFTIYQNTMFCIRFVENIKKIHEFLFLMRDYLEVVTEKMKMFGNIIITYKSYIGFYNDMMNQCTKLENILFKLKTVRPLNLNLLKVQQIGSVMNQFYQFYNNKEYETSILFSFECIGFLNNIESFSTRIGNGVTKCKFSKTTNIKKMVYPALLSGIKNDISISKNIIITGPNASGKTTILKATLINIILSQQFGYGCYESAQIKLYNYLHCYLNIPDTSGRDSLFQAEARRCKEILDCIKENNGQHFCIFDELYSGTNPEEAVLSANAFMNYLNKRADCLLTTHYTELCTLLKDMNNYKMETIEKDSKITYTYNLISGISKVKGGIKILNDMNFPEEILNNI